MAAGSLSTSRTSWPFSSSSRATERPTLPAPAMATRISAPRWAGARSAASTASASLSRITTCTRSPSCSTVSSPGSRPSPNRVRNATRAPEASSSRLIRSPIQAVSTCTSASRTVPLGSRHSRLGAVRQQPAQHLVGGPADRRHRGDAQPLVDLGAARVVDPGHDVVDAERLAGHPGGDDVGVVAAADRGERLRLLDARLDAGCPGRSRCR